jgi:hypothetical protein
VAYYAGVEAHVQMLAAMRGPGESYSDVILRLARAYAPASSPLSGGHFLAGRLPPESAPLTGRQLMGVLERFVADNP